MMMMMMMVMMVMMVMMMMMMMMMNNHRIRSQLCSPLHSGSSSWQTVVLAPTELTRGKIPPGGDDDASMDDDDDDDDDEVSITLKECRWELEHKQFEWQGIDREAHTQSDYHHQDGDDYHHEDGDYLLNLVVFFFLVFSF